MGKLVTIERKKLDPNRCYGVIVSQSVALTLLHCEDDFQFDGYMVMRTKDITLCKSTKSNDYGERLMRREGLWENIPQWVKKLSIGGWPDLIADLVGKVVIIEDEVREGFHIGPLLEAQAKHATIHYFDGCGQLQDVERVAYSRITSVKFGDRYSTIHAKYLRTPSRDRSRARRAKGYGVAVEYDLLWSFHRDDCLHFLTATSPMAIRRLRSCMEDRQAMDESDFWAHLEYRVCHEIEGLKQPSLRRYWCDGFIPDQYEINEPSPHISGYVWMGVGPRHQEEWEFDLLLPGPVESRVNIVWSTLLPPPNVTRWLTIGSDWQTTRG